MQRKLQRRRAEGEARRQLAKLNVQPLDNPLVALRQVLAEMVALKDLLAERVETAGSDDELAVIEAYRRSLDSTVKALTDAGRLGIEAMLADIEVEIAQRHVALLERALDAALRAVGLEDDALMQARHALGQQLALAARSNGAEHR